MDIDPNENRERHDLPFGPVIVDQPKASGLPRSTKPHIAIVTLKLDIRAINVNETFDLCIMGDNALKKYGLARKGQFIVKGTSEADCIRKLTKILENINNG